MTEDVQKQADPSAQQSEAIDYASMLEQKEKEIQALKAHKEALLDETKRAKRKAEEEAQEKARLKEQQLEKNGQFEQLYKSANERYEAAIAEIKLRDQQKASEVAKNEAMKLAGQLADGYNAELLAEFVQKRIKYTDEGVKVLDAHGNLTVSGLDELKNEFSNSEKFKSLLRGSRATGGGAPGSGGGTNGASLIDKAVFDTWTPKQKMDFSLKGGKLK